MSEEKPPLNWKSALPPEWAPPPEQQFEEVPDASLPGLPESKSTTRRAVVHPGLRQVTILEMGVKCPRCGAFGEDRNQEVIESLRRGGAIRVDCSQCGLPMVLRRPPVAKPKPLLEVVGGTATQERAAFDRMMKRGDRR